VFIILLLYYYPVTNLETLKNDILYQNVSNLFKKQNLAKTNIVQVSYKVANLIAS